MDKNTKSFEGKTIKSVKQQAINAWVFEFADGTQRVIWAEIDGPMNLGQLWVTNTL
jgi:hypothetical protein